MAPGLYIVLMTVIYFVAGSAAVLIWCSLLQLLRLCCIIMKEKADERRRYRARADPEHGLPNEHEAEPPASETHEENDTQPRSPDIEMGLL